MVNHIVLLKLKPGIERGDPRVRDAIGALLALRGRIDGIERWDHGWNFTERPIAYDFALDSTFRSRADFDAYGPHPAHQEAIVKLRPLMDWVLCDFEPEAGGSAASA